MHVLLAILLLLWGILKGTYCHSTVTTCDRIIQHGYPCENYTVTTTDGYLLTIFRIPYSPRGDNPSVINKPAVLLVHCLFSSSDVWLLNGPDSGLPYMLADVGYDVWLANSRGTVYSQHLSLAPNSEAFWDFSLDEIGRYDLPVTIDYITSTTEQSSIHYVGYSQGTTALMMLLSLEPSYNQKIKTSHLLGPGVFMCRMRSQVTHIGVQVVFQPIIYSRLASKSMTIHPLFHLLRTISPTVCKWTPAVCVLVMDWITGWGSPHLNRALLSEMVKIIPADVSNRQIIQYLQYAKSCEFNAYDFGYQGNMQKYQNADPPIYNLANVQPQTPIDLYYSDNDFFVSVEDVHDLYTILGDRISLHRVKYPKFNHFDFIMAKNIKDVLHSCIVDKMQKYEGRTYNGSTCNNFQNKPF